MKQLFSINGKNPWFWAFIIIAVTLFFAMPIMSHSAGNSGDEDGFQIPQSENVLNYYASHKQDTTCMTFENLKYYGCSFDVATAWWNRTFHVDNIATTRHTANALCGWLVVLFVGLIAYRIGGWRSGVLAMVLMFLSPRFLGHSFNNPKDIPFAAGVTMSIYYMLMFFRQAPRAKWSTMIMLAVSIAFAISIRVGGLILFGYLALWGLAWLICSTRYRRNALNAQLRRGQTKTGFVAAIDSGATWTTIFWALVISLVGFLLSLIVWPYAAQAPFKHTIESYHAMSQFAIAIRQIYEGQMVWSDALPWYYTPKFIFTTIPVAVILGWIAYCFTGAWSKDYPDGTCAVTEESVAADSNSKNTKVAKSAKKEVQRGEKTFRNNRMESFLLYFVFLFPVAWIVYTKANVYGGWRHSLFAYPPMVVVSALGFNGFIKLFEKEGAAKWHIAAKWAATLLPFLMLIGPCCHIIRNHPYEYVYFNRLCGGTKKAFANYEMDYYYHSMREATEWVIKNAQPSPLQTGKRIVVGSWHVNSLEYFLRNDTTKFQKRFVRWYSRGDYDWDYAVFTLTGIDPAYLTNKKVFPPKNMVHEIDVDGVPIAIVLKRDDKSDFYGSELKNKGLLDSALVMFHKALKVNPYNESALMDMAEIYLQKNMPDSALWACNRFFEFEPNNDNANYFAAYAHLQKNDVNGALALCQNVLKHNYKYGMAYQLIATIYAQQNNLPGAIGIIQQAMGADQASQPLMQLYVQIKQAQGLDQRQAVISFYSDMASSLRKRHKNGEAEMYESYIAQM